MPTTRNEEYRYTDISPILQTVPRVRPQVAWPAARAQPAHSTPSARACRYVARACDGLWRRRAVHRHSKASHRACTPRAEAPARLRQSVCEALLCLRACACATQPPRPLTAERRMAGPLSAHSARRTRRLERSPRSVVSAGARAKTARAPQVAEGAPAAAEAAAGQHALEAACARLVVVDGAVAPALSDVGGLPGGAYLGGLAGAPAELVGPHLARALPSAEAGAQGVGARRAGARRGRSLPPASSGGARCYREKQPASERRQGRSVCACASPAGMCYA